MFKTWPRRRARMKGSTAFIMATGPNLSTSIRWRMADRATFQDAFVPVTGIVDEHADRTVRRFGRIDAAVDGPLAGHGKDWLYRSNGRELQQRLAGYASRVHEASPSTFVATRGARPLALPVRVGGALLAAWALKDQAAPA